jgi:polyphosphate:AMP phosphotransferase
MDPRHIRVHAFGPRDEHERLRPPMWRYWKALPPRGRLGIFMNAWYNELLVGHFRGRLSKSKFDAYAEQVPHIERMLHAEGVTVLKFWIHLSKAEQKRRLEALDADPRTSWRVTKADWRAFRMYNDAHPVWERLLRETSTAEAPWHVVEGADERYRNLTVGKILLQAMQQAQRAHRRPRRTVTAQTPQAIDNVKLMRDLVLSQRLDEKAYDTALEHEQGRLAKLTRHKRFARHALVLVFEGVDAAGKGGAIRRVTGALDARQYVTVPIAAPSDEEKAHPYLWRFWRHVPPLRGITIFDRSWYGRVLVERVERLCPPQDWMRAYSEINQFEQQLSDAGTIVVKFWLQISRAEQLKRFHAREHTAFKRFKITPDDWRNRKRWDDYEAAVCDMVDRTSTEIAPWTLVEANDKRFARIKVLRTIADRLDRALKR